MKRPISQVHDFPDQPASAPRRTCDSCVVRGKAICAGLQSEELSGLNQIARHRRLKAGQKIISDQDLPDYFAIVLSGSAKLTKVLPDGRQQIVGLLFPSDFVGWPFESHGSSHAEAATDMQLCSFPAAAFERLVKQHSGIQHQLFRNAFTQIEAAQDWMLLLGRMTAREKVANLFVMIARRSRGLDSCEFDSSGRERFDLPLSRSDTADFLGLTLETVSRQFRALKSEGIIRLDGTRTVTILDPIKLAAAATSPFI
ncbi:MAG: Crp/Fnr family transcriptional regulator [Hyphomicrobium sp.]